MNKQCLLLCCCLAASAPLTAQFGFNFNLTALDSLDCPFDASKRVQYPRRWILYQTKDGNWDGPVDSSRCISATYQNFRMRINMNQIDRQRPLFMRLSTRGLNALRDLDTNAIYKMRHSFQVSNTSIQPVLGTLCEQDVCSGMTLIIQTPMPEQRIQKGFYVNSSFASNSYFDLESCFPSEYFAGQRLQEIILKWTFNPNTTLQANSFIEISGVSIVQPSAPGPISKVAVTNANLNSSTGEYNITLMQAADRRPGFNPNYLLLYKARTFPSAATPSFVDASITPNPSERRVINLNLQQFDYLEIQPFTILRGALAANSDTLRHRVNVVNRGGNICLSLVEFVSNNESEYRHYGGQISLNNAASCMQFKNRSALRVMENATLHYGDNGTGMLALCDNSRIVLERDARLTIDAVLNIAECGAPEGSQVYLDLQPGSLCTFTENARLTNQYSKQSQLKLKVLMNGGILDDQALPADQRAIIERIYTQPKPVFAQNFRIYPNPAAETAHFAYTAAADEMLLLQWIDVRGAVVREETQPAPRGYSEGVIKTPEQSGVYWLRVVGSGGQAGYRVVRL